jgi:hypothetical protein
MNSWSTRTLRRRENPGHALSGLVRYTLHDVAVSRVAMLGAEPFSTEKMDVIELDMRVVVGVGHSYPLIVRVVRDARGFFDNIEIVACVRDPDAVAESVMQDVGVLSHALKGGIAGRRDNSRLAPYTVKSEAERGTAIGLERVGARALITGEGR